MGSGFASTVILQQFVPQTNYYAKKPQTQPTNQKSQNKPLPRSKSASILDRCSFDYTLQ